ncbi:MAG: hypothetical protein MN733_10670 [Nitrososphaera sp.]|nr:hypothetical protein [Nitrososphaera sp.]
MAKRRLREYSKLLAEKVMDLGNLALASIVFVQLLPDEPFSGRIVLLGVTSFLVCHAVSYYVMRGGDA